MSRPETLRSTSVAVRPKPLGAKALRGAVALLLAGAAALGGCGGGSDPPASAPPITHDVPLAELQQQFVSVVRTLSPQVVQIQSARGLGSGVVFDDHGDVVTNAHVVVGDRRFVVTLAGGERHRATLVGADQSHDIAVVNIVGVRPAPATFAVSPQPQVGDLVLAIGNPLGLRSSVTQGIVSALDRTVSEGGGVVLSPVIQTSAEINPGNSGGALANLSGQVIGIPTLAALDPELGGGQAAGIGFAIPSTTVWQVATRLIGSD